MFLFTKKRGQPQYDQEQLVIGLQHLIHQMTERIQVMALDLTKLNAAVARNTKAVDALIAAHTDPAAQAAVDAVADVLDTESAKAEAAAPAAA